MKRPYILLLAVLAASFAPEPARQPSPLPTMPPAPSAPDQFGLIPAQFTDLPGWRDDTAAAVLPALNRTCDRLLKQPNDKSVGQNGMGGTVADWYTPCSAARRIGGFPVRDARPAAAAGRIRPRIRPDRRVPDMPVASPRLAATQKTLDRPLGERVLSPVFKTDRMRSYLHCP